jgi:hypothetical protein
MSIIKFMYLRVNQGDPEIPPGNPPEAPPDEPPIGIPPDNPTEVPEPPDEIPPEVPPEVPPPPAATARMRDNTIPLKEDKKTPGFGILA